jgi:hypothetical protein
MRDFIWVIIIGVILIIGVVFLGVGLKFYKDYLGCENEYSPWCYDDWVCTAYPEGDPKRYPAKVAYSTARTCSTPAGNGATSYSCIAPT